MKLGHGGHHGLGRANIPDAPACHGVALGHAAYHHGALIHVGQVGHGHMMLPVGQLAVDFIGDHHDIGAAQHLGNGLQVPPTHNAAGGVAGEGQQHGLGFGCDGSAQLLGGQPKFVLGLKLHIHRRASGHGDQRPVADKGGHRDNHLVPGIDEAAEGQVQRLAAAHGHENLAGKVII
ncbi:hypothetical protein SDC9_101461 [bioreactor metagenome]|uniref:Uncharacterized protein n=1 Tax=bioreactor metagenome TaxID=1076179 RepID=A0A645AN66_9ZZZZ